MSVILRYRTGEQEHAVEVDRDPFPMGRARENALVLSGAGVSRRHCELLRRGASYAVRDVGSARGTLLNGVALAPQTPHVLSHGDRLQVGVHALEVAFEERAAPDSHGAREERPDPQPPGSPDLEPDRNADLEPDLELLLETIAELHQELAPLELLPAILDRAIELCGAERGLLLLRGAGDSFETTIARGQGAETLTRVEGTSQSIPRRVLESGQPVCATGGPNEWGEDASQSMKQYALRAILCVPLRFRGEVQGAIYVDTQRVQAGLGRRQQLLLEALAAQCAVALERARQLAAEASARAASEAEAQRLRGGEGEAPPALSEAMQATLRQLERVADSDLSVLLTGETGVGKEVCARFLHARSHRRQAPFVVLDCGAVPENLLESVLFGHVKGAFTGATSDSEGLARRAHGGTLLLDEIGELPLALQPKLLRFLEERTLLPVGSGQREAVDVRVVACTHRDLAAMVEARTFREDLLFRLNAFPVQVPPLRERQADLGSLARALLARARVAARAPRVVDFSQAALAALRRYEWPGNVRELAHRIQRAAVVAEPPFITARDLDLPEGEGGALPPLQAARKRANERFERQYVRELLRRHAGAVQAAAAEAEVSRQLFQRLMAKHGIQRASFLDDPR